MASIVVYGASLSGGGFCLGRETRARCRAAIRVYWHIHTPATRIIMSPGYFKNLPHQRKSMAEMMSRYMHMCGHVPFEHMHTRSSAWDTASETLTAIDVIDKEGLSRDVIAVSSNYHLPRIRFLWRRAGWRIQTYGAGYPMSKKWILREPAAYTITLLGVDKTRAWRYIRK